MWCRGQCPLEGRRGSKTEYISQKLESRVRANISVMVQTKAKGHMTGWGACGRFGFSHSANWDRMLECEANIGFHFIMPLLYETSVIRLRLVGLLCGTELRFFTDTTNLAALKVDIITAALPVSSIDPSCVIRRQLLDAFGESVS